MNTLNTMTDEKINERIALLCGWKGPFQQEWIPEYGRAAEPFYCFAGTDEDGDRYPLPNYAADLNACHEFEKTLSRATLHKYMTVMQDVKGLGGNNHWLNFHATARQRCEAFLRVHGQWEEAE